MPREGIFTSRYSVAVWQMWLVNGMNAVCNHIGDETTRGATVERELFARVLCSSSFGYSPSVERLTSYYQPIFPVPAGGSLLHNPPKDIEVPWAIIPRLAQSSRACGADHYEKIKTSLPLLLDRTRLCAPQNVEILVDNGASQPALADLLSSQPISLQKLRSVGSSHNPEYRQVDWPRATPCTSGG